MNNKQIEMTACENGRSSVNMGDTVNIKIPKGASKVISTIRDAGFEAYIVGGCVRDAILGKTPMDWDITTSADPVKVKSLFRRTVDTGLKHGTVTVLINGESYEVTTYRIDGEYEDARHPKQVSFTSDISEDLRRRDFTINAMAYDENEGLIDLFGGMDDLRDGIIRCVGSSMERFTEDALRIMRALRFSAQLGFEIAEDTCTAMKALSPNLKMISAERIQAELIKLLVSEHPERLLDGYECGIIPVILPELALCIETPQHNPHHMYSVGEHIVRSVCAADRDPIIRLAMLLHDVAKPLCITTDSDGIDHFRGHAQKSVDIARDIMRRLKLDNYTIKSVLKLIESHDIKTPPEKRAVRRLLSKLGSEYFLPLMEVKRADTMAQSEYQREEKLAHIEALTATFYAIMEADECLSIKDLAINGNDVISLGIAPGKEVGEVLKKLLDTVLEEPGLNNRDDLISKVEGWKKSGQLII